MSNLENGTRSGGCLCGAVRFEVAVPEGHIHACHCGMCRRWTAGPFMSVNCPGVPDFESADSLRWHRTSDWAERGFCGTCGSSLFFRLAKQPEMLTVVAVEAFDDAAGLELRQHIYIDDKPDYYEFADQAERLTGAEFRKLIGAE